MYLALFIVNTLCRVFFPLLIFPHPILAALGSYIFDMNDGYLAYKSNFSWKTYHRFDKILDLYWYVFILVYGWQTANKEVFLVLFVYRFIGQVLSIVTLKQKFLVYFPDILEHYFYLYLLFSLFPSTEFLTQGFWQIPSLMLSLAVSLWRERLIHVKHQHFFSATWVPKPHWKDEVKS